MLCLNCHRPLRVSNSRLQRNRNQVWRRRSCQACGAVFTSEERLDLTKAISVAGRPFSRDKLFLSLYMACRHRPTALQDAGGLTAAVISQLWPLIRRDGLEAGVIRQSAYAALARFDTAAAVQYQAYHRPKATRRTDSR